MANISIILIFSIILGTSLSRAAPEERIVNRFQVTRLLRDHFNSNEAPFASSRHPIRGMAARKTMLRYIKNQVELLEVKASQKELTASVQEDTYSTDIHYNGVDHNVTATNVLFILHPTNNETLDNDEPLMLLANYDSDEGGNHVDEGSGVAALLVLAEALIQDLSPSPATGKPKARLTRSVIFAFTDVAFKKYLDKRHSVRGQTGATRIATHWLPAYLADRKGFHGAIVVDNILNYNPAERTQIVENLGFDRNFGSAYSQMAEKVFAGDFLGLVHRDDRLDMPIVTEFEKAWQTANYAPKDPDSVPLEPRIIRFTFTQDMSEVAQSVNHFLNSEQTAFWNHHIERQSKLYPAVTLTDTRILRVTGCQNMCNVQAMTTSENLAFMGQTITALKQVIVEMQTDKNGALPTVHGSTTVLTVSVILAYITGKALF